MRRNKRWMVARGLSVGLLGPGAALAQTQPSSAVIGNPLIALGGRSDAGLARGGTGLQFVATSADGLTANVCACSGWNLVLGNAQLVQSVEAFSFTPVGASSITRVQDGAATQLRVTHDFHPAPISTNLYEIVVSVENLGSATVQPSYTRTVGWAGVPELTALQVDPAFWTEQSTPDGLGGVFETGLPATEPGATHVLRPYLGA